MATPRKWAEIVETFDPPRPQKIQVDVADEFLEIPLFLAEDRFVAILKQLAVTAILPVETDGISGQQPLHDTCDRKFTRSNQQVHMVRDQGPSQALRARRGDNTPEVVYKSLSVGIRAENLTAFDPTHDDVVHSSGGIDAGLAWLDSSLAIRMIIVKHNSIDVPSFS
jgi:hypothetical protein